MTNVKFRILRLFCKRYQCCDFFQTSDVKVNLPFGCDCARADFSTDFISAARSDHSLFQCQQTVLNITICSTKACSQLNCHVSALSKLCLQSNIEIYIFDSVTIIKCCVTKFDSRKSIFWIFSVYNIFHDHHHNIINSTHE